MLQTGGINIHTPPHPSHIHTIKSDLLVTHCLRIDDNVQYSTNLETQKVSFFFFNFLVYCFLSFYVEQGFLSYIIARVTLGQ